MRVFGQEQKPAPSADNPARSVPPSPNWN